MAKRGEATPSGSASAGGADSRGGADDLRERVGDGGVALGGERTAQGRGVQRGAGRVNAPSVYGRRDSEQHGSAFFVGRNGSASARNICYARTASSRTDRFSSSNQTGAHAIFPNHSVQDRWSPSSKHYLNVRPDFSLDPI